MSGYVVTVTTDPRRADALRAELLGPKRYQTLTLEEEADAGRAFFSDPGGLAYYGMPPSQWFARGIRILGRTCTEATPDVTAAPIGRAVAKAVGRPAGVAGLFAGSGNLMPHIARALETPARGMEADENAARDTAPARYAVIQHTPVEPVFHVILKVR